MKSHNLKIILGAAMLATSSLSAAPLWAADALVTAAVASPDRPEADRKLDESRKPADVLDFLGLKSGDQALDILAGGGYYTRIMATIVGADGKVVAVNVPSFSGSEKSLRTWADLTAQPDNIELALQYFGDFKAKDANYDFAMLHLVYHDAYWESEKFRFPRAEPDQFLANLYKAIKPGGIVGVVDHVGVGDDTRALVEAMHRIEPDVVKADFAKAGFVLEAESDILAVPGDDHSKNVFDPAIRGETDRFVYKFRKPAS